MCEMLMMDVLMMDVLRLFVTAEKLWTHLTE